MRIALDYDGTYTADPELWGAFIAKARERGHDLVMVTMRRIGNEQIENPPCAVVYTNRRAKAPFMERCGYKIDVWIDDNPHWIFENSR